MYRYLRPWLMRMNPEDAHHLTLRLLRYVGPGLASWLRSFLQVPVSPSVQLCGLHFPNVVGLAAGYDKDGTSYIGLSGLGFGHIELGTVTLQPQPGNPAPRLFRLEEDRALINRMGFPGRGAAALVQRLKRERPPGLILGVNIGKNKDTPLESAADEYVTLLEMFAPWCDYITVNVSSPNTPDLRRLQARHPLEVMLQKLAQSRRLVAGRLGRFVPIFVKLAPDLQDEELDEAVGAIQATGMDGVIATNTSLGRQGLRSAARIERGGLSGAPLMVRSTEVVRQIFRMTYGRLPIIAVGGIFSSRDALMKLEAGASLVQLYTGLIYEGPRLPAQILRVVSELSADERRTLLARPFG